MQPRVTARSPAMRAGPEGAASRAGVGGSPRPARLPRAPRVSWRGSPLGSGRASLWQVVRAPPPSPCAQSPAGAGAPAPPGLNSPPGRRSRARRRGGAGPQPSPPLPAPPHPCPPGPPLGPLLGTGWRAGDAGSQSRLHHFPVGDPVPGPAQLSRVKERVPRGVVTGLDPAHRPGARP